MSESASRRSVRLLPWLPGLLGLAALVVLAPRSLADAADPLRGPTDNLRRTAFIGNAGQTDARVLFHAPGERGTVFFTRESVVLDLGGGTPGSRVPLEIRFLGANPSPDVTGTPSTSRSHFFRGRDPRAWRTGVPMHSEIAYRGLWPGIDLRYRAEADCIKYEYEVAPGADPSRISLEYRGALGLRIDTAGRLCVETAAGSIVEEAPVAWVKTPNGRSPVPARFALSGSDRLGFEVGARDPGLALVIDPGLLWSSFLGGSADERAYAVATDPAGRIFLIGWSQSPDFPVTSGSFDTTHAGGFDALVARIDPRSGSLDWCTFLGGGNWDKGLAITLDGDTPVIGGWTQSRDFPTTPGAYDSVFGTANDQAFVARLGPEGDRLLWCTLFGGSGTQALYGLRIDSEGNPVLAGWTSSQDLPTTPGAYDRDFNGRDDLFFAKLNPGGSDLLWCTYVGGWRGDHAYCLVLDSDENLIAAGGTLSDNFPVTPGVLGPKHHGGFLDAFVLGLSSSGDALLWATYLGSPGMDEAWGLALDRSGDVLVAGRTDSPAFPVSAAAYDTTHNGGLDVFAARLDSEGRSIRWATYLGGAAEDRLWTMAADSLGFMTLAGMTLSPDFPMPSTAWKPYPADSTEAFLARVDTSGKYLLWGSYLGGSGNEEGYAVAVDGEGHVVLIGETSSSDFPMSPDAWDSSYHQGADVFLAKIEMLDDRTAPELGLRLFQEPHLSAQMGVRLLSNEALDSSSVTVCVDGVPAPVAPEDPERRLWRAGPWALPAGDSIPLTARASDVAGWEREVATAFSSTWAAAGISGVARSPDGRFALRFDAGSLTSGQCIVILPVEGAEAGVASSPRRYEAGPRGILARPAWVEFRYDPDECPAAGPAGFFIELDGSPLPGPRVDAGARTVSAPTRELGVFTLTTRN